MRLFTPSDDLSEKEFTSLVVGTKTNPGLARTLNWKAYHTLRSRGSEPGFPDWTLARERVVFLELKTAKGTVSVAQREWLAALNAANVEAYVVRPAHLDAVKLVLQARGPFFGWSAVQLDARNALLEDMS